MRALIVQFFPQFLRKSIRATQQFANNCFWAVLGLLPDNLLIGLANYLLRTRHKIHEQIRRQTALRYPEINPAILSQSGLPMQKSILDSNNPWSKLSLPPIHTPGMLSDTEKQYYLYITEFYQGLGEVVEIGPWLGLSTRHIMQGLSANPNFTNKKLHVFDDFVWRSDWMEKWLVDSDIEAPVQHASFQHLFNAQTRSIKPWLHTTRAKLIDNHGNESLPVIQWDIGPIELIIVDCGRRLSVNDAWYSVFSPYFVKDKTLVVLQDWQTHKRVPEIYWENMKLFTDSKESSLELIHELPNACLATFLYRG